MTQHSFQKTGIWHTDNQLPCQDVILTSENELFSLIVLADGVSGCGHGGLGAEKAAQALWDFIQTEGEEIFGYCGQKLRYLLLEHVLYYLELAALAEKTDVAELASTLAFVCVKKKTGQAIIGSLGNGSVIRLTEDTLHPAPAPVKRAGQPFVTTSPFAYKAMAIQYESLAVGDCVLLGSDGFAHASLAARRGGIQIREALEKFEFSELDRFLEEYPEMDDCSYVVIRHSRK